MIFERTEIDGVWRVGIDPSEDDRGFFARAFCAAEFADRGLASQFEQSSISRNRKAGTLRGMHYSQGSYAETKLVRCGRGAIFDVAVDIRPGSPTWGRWVGEELTADNARALYIAPGIAHGFQTLADDTDVFYQITPPYRAGVGSGFRWNDPVFSIDWPIADAILSPRDATYENWDA